MPGGGLRDDAATAHEQWSGNVLATLTWGSADPLTVASGESRTFALRFMTRGSLDCSKEMRLDPDAGITLPTAAIAFQSVSFVPTQGL